MDERVDAEANQAVWCGDVGLSFGGSAVLHYMIILAIALAGYAGGSGWVLLSGIAALMLTTIAGENVMTRVLVTGDADVMHTSLRQIFENAFWPSCAAFAFGAGVTMIGG